jgi:uncharacterized membrane protein YeaQ/YmgE (transglycosylase-associated protein family)
MIEFLILLVIAGICGSLAQALAGYTHGGCLVSIALGFIGALLGSWLARLLRLPDIFTVNGFPVVWSIIGAALFVALLGMLTVRRRLPP